MSARITVNLTATGELEIWLNEQGRDLLVRELGGLSEKSDHFHLGPKGIGEVEVSTHAYRPDDKVLEYGKVLFRTDAWDNHHYPHVMTEPAQRPSRYSTDDGALDLPRDSRYGLPMDRHIDFEGIENFRDFGGYRTIYGRELSRGRLYRSGFHGKATDGDLLRMRDLGIATIVDLRRPDERVREPSRRWPGFAGEIIQNDMTSAHPDWAAQMKGLTELTPQWFIDDGLAYYRRSPFEPRHIDLFARYFRHLAEKGGPLLVHCAAGKDRTGLICALTHHVAGVPRDDMMADYLLTNDEARIARKVEFLGPWIEERTGLRASEETLRTAVSVRADYLETAFTEIEAAHGSIDAYVRDVLGVDASLRERIHEKLLD